MFGHRFFGARYFGPRYFGDGGSGTPPVTAVDEWIIRARRRGRR